MPKGQPHRNTNHENSSADYTREPRDSYVTAWSDVADQKPG